ncbi:alpha/beta hydrolase [Streptomyces sp. NPDC051639]|uniref:alpha/beta fold hydrolase n=1 Tax=unclassified Streptomyces TaxID=2593676 RepID=UPI002001DB90|nr:MULTISPECIES: alpha/beta hydrolase [unclassified Streptomyces]
MFEDNLGRNESLTPGVHEIVIDGVIQRYHVAGDGPVCLVHSGGPGVHWEYLRMPLLERHMTAVYVAPVGAGESGELSDGHYSMERYARFVDGLVDHLGVPEVSLMGHSAGGFVALQYELDHPGKLAGLILYDSAPLFGPDLHAEAEVQMSAFEQRHAGRSEVADVVAAYRQSETPRTTKSEVTEHVRRLLPAYFADYWGMPNELREAVGNVEVEYIPSAGNWDVRDALGKVSIPTQILVGRYDWICPVRWAEEMHEEIAGSRLTVFESSGHFVHLEEPEAFVRTVTEFLADVAGRTGDHPKETRR